MKVVVIGGGPAGIMSAISAKNSGNDVILIEKMNSLGKKLLITGKGRCNITSSLNINEFIQNIPGNGRFLYSAFQNFTNEDIINLLKKHNVKVKEERGNRIFPVSDKSKDVLDAFYEELKNLNVKIYTNSTVNQIIVKDGSVTGVEYTFNNNKYTINADKVILATGGKSYPTTGSTGDGYEMAKKLGHTITEIKPSLIPIVANENSAIEKINLEGYKNSKELCKSLQGLSLKNVKIQFEDIEKNKVIYDDFGEMLFTHFGVSGPIILSLSKTVAALLKANKTNIDLLIDLKPALTFEKLEARVQRDFEQYSRKQLLNGMKDLLPQRLIPVVLDQAYLDEEKPVNQISKEERKRLVEVLKGLSVSITGTRPLAEAIVTAGGVSIKEIEPKTLRSKLWQGLYFAGEVIDIDGYTGGYNLQAAFSTGYAAGTAAAYQ